MKTLMLCTVLFLQELPLEAREMFQTMAAIELYRAQREVANYFELAYLKLSDHPDVARDVRNHFSEQLIKPLIKGLRMLKLSYHCLQTSRQA
jgi:hypothetical protein